MAELRIVNGPEAGRTVTLGTAPVVLGRHPDCDIVIPVIAVGRHHARIEWREGRYFIQDLDTRGGMYVNGRQLHSAAIPLEHNDRIQICDRQFVFLDTP